MLKKPSAQAPACPLMTEATVDWDQEGAFSDMEHPCLEEALSCYKLTGSDVTLLRHNENLTYRVGRNYLLQIHEHVEGFQTDFYYEGFDRTQVRLAELAFQAHLQKQGMRVREAIENNRGERITSLSSGTTATVSKWIEGESLDHLELNDELCRQVGALTAHLHSSAKGFRSSSVISYDKQHCKSTKDRLRAMEDRGLDPVFSDLMQRACDCVGDALQNVQEEFVMLHGDLSPSNILKTPEGLVPIDFSFLGFGHPMFDLSILFGGFSGLSRRQKIAEGYRAAGGTIRYDILDACYVLDLLDWLGIHFEQCKKLDWFDARMKRWCKEIIDPYVRAERLFADDFYLLHATD